MTSISAWLRVIRVRFLLASVLSVSVALALAARHDGTLDLLHAALTLGGVLALHASVDLLNDYWDHKRGIDTAAGRTRISGGTGVLPEGLLNPQSVYRAGILFLVIGGAVGAYFVTTHGIPIALMLGFAVAAIYFYSTKIVNVGLGEFFVAVKGCMIVLGSFYIQHGSLESDAVLAGVAMGSLSSLVLFVASFPDFEADKAGGRRTLVIMAGKRRASVLFWLFPAVTYGAIVAGAGAGVLPYAALITLAAVPIVAAAGVGLARHCMSATDQLMPHLSRALAFGRIAGALLAAGIAVSSFCPEWWC